MKIFSPCNEPVEFAQRVRRPGQAWLASHPSGRPHAYWTEWVECKQYLADEFRSLCAYSLTYEPVGTVDHFISCNVDRQQAYEWGNYRYAAGWINSCKQDQDARIQFLDPFEAEDNWFEIILPSLQMKLADDLKNRVSPEQYQRAKNTLEKLHLVNDPRARRQRQHWYQQYQAGKITLDGIEVHAPLLARAIRQQEATVAQFNTSQTSS